ncbi:hypothetical protein ACHAWU_002335 [Discostella pseudostelligera]|uniref:Uncharacterized protein n=1 Tax=Discostella pseudostelligera TaxID=259834 RepID=A0ABD3MP30_9STRA
MAAAAASIATISSSPSSAATTTTTTTSLSSSKPLTPSSLLSDSSKVVSAVLSSNPFPAGYHPLGYSLTKLGKTFLEFGRSNESDVGVFLLTLKGGRRRNIKSLKQQWTTIVRISKGGDHMRVLRKLPEIVEFCLAAGFID